MENKSFKYSISDEERKYIANDVLVVKEALRELAKLFLNNLYGKTASSMDSSFKLAYVKEDKTIGFLPVAEAIKKPGYIPVGSAITIRAAQKNYHGKDNRGFIYADTDSIHCNLEPEEIVGIKVHDKDFCLTRHMK